MDAEKKVEVTGPWSLAAYYVKQHGSITFGVITVIAMWRLMVAPELDRKATEGEMQRAILQELHNTTLEQKDIAEHMKLTAEILDRITARQGTIQ